MPTQAEVLCDGTVGGEEPLGLARGLKSLHVSLALTGGLCEFSARLLRYRCWRWPTPGSHSRVAAASLVNLSVTITRGTYDKPVSSLRKNFFAAYVSRRRWTKISSTFPS